jgi:hypothetical protein
LTTPDRLRSAIADDRLPVRHPVTRPAVQAAVDYLDKLFYWYRRRGRGIPMVVALIGPPGAGASTAALDFLHRHVHQFSAVFHADLAHAGEDTSAIDTVPVHPGEVLGHWLPEAGMPAPLIPDPTAERVAWWRTVTLTGAAVLVDNAVYVEQIRPLIPAGPSVVLVTTHADVNGYTLDRFINVVSVTPERTPIGAS